MRGHDEGTDRPWSPGYFSAFADSECFSCSKVTQGKTAELLYTSSDWDYYYCYRCRGWFKRPFAAGNIILAVKDRRQVKQLTWMYTSHMEAMHANRVMVESIGRFWRGLERFLTRA